MVSALRCTVLIMNRGCKLVLAQRSGFVFRLIMARPAVVSLMIPLERSLLNAWSKAFVLRYASLSMVVPFRSEEHAL